MDAFEKLKNTISLVSDREGREMLIRGYLDEHSNNGHEPAEVWALIDIEAPEIIVSNRQLKEKIQESYSAIVAHNDPPYIFRHGGGLARIQPTETGQPVIKQLNEHSMRGILSSCAEWFTVQNNKNIAISPPNDVVNGVLNMASWPDIPVITGIVETPVIRPDGSILNTHGYDAGTKLYYYPTTKANVSNIPDTPTAADIETAKNLLLEVFCDFPFDTPTSRANVLAALCTPVVRPLILGPTPLCCIDKPQVGSGASLIATVIARAATGRAATMQTAPRDPDEWRKTITSALMQGRGVVVLDNLEGSLYDASLAAVLTATTFGARQLGQLEIKDIPNMATWIATGNNIQLGGDLPRRAYLVRIDAGIARPWLRDVEKFKHPELEAWVSENRTQILAAILTIARAWIVAGKPKPQELPRLGGYEGWVNVLGGILNYAGITGFLANLMELYERNDAETPAWSAFVSTWHEIFQDREITSADLLNEITTNETFESVLPIDPPHRDKKTKLIDDTGFTRKLGKALIARKERIYPGEKCDYQLLLTGVSHQAKKWKVVEKRGVCQDETPRSKAKRELREYESTSNAKPENSQMLVRGETNTPNSPDKANLAISDETPPNEEILELPDPPEVL